MSKINNRLLTIFLSLGIVFFIVVVYMFLGNEIFPKPVKHTIIFTGLKIVKNEYLDTSFMHKSVAESMNDDEPLREICKVSLLNLSDSVAYINSTNFDITRLFAPNSIEAPLNSTIPSTTFGDKYKIVIIKGLHTLTEFQIGDLNTFLDISSKKYQSTEKKDIKLISNDKKIIAFASFTID